MANQASDGRLVFDTKLNTAEFEKELEKLQKTEIKLETTMDERAIQQMVQAIKPPTVRLEIATQESEQGFENAMVAMEKRQLVVSADLTGVEQALARLAQKLESLQKNWAGAVGGALSGVDSAGLNEALGTAATAAATAQEKLSTAKALMATDVQTIHTEMTTLITQTSTQVLAMVESMNTIVSQGEVGAAKAGSDLARGAGDGYMRETALLNAVKQSTARALHSLQENTQAFRSAGAELVQEMASGVTGEGGTLRAAMRQVVASALAAAQSTTATGSVFRPQSRWYPKRTGLEYVPYDEYPALLHRGESVLTAAEAAVWRGGQTAMREQAPQPAGIDYQALAAAIWNGAPQGQAPEITLDGAVLGRMLEPYVSVLQGERVRGGRFG